MALAYKTKVGRSGVVDNGALSTDRLADGTPILSAEMVSTQERRATITVLRDVELVSGEVTELVELLVGDPNALSHFDRPGPDPNLDGCIGIGWIEGGAPRGNGLRLVPCKTDHGLSSSMMGVPAARSLARGIGGPGCLPT